MAQDLWSPSNPMVATDATDVGYSPYALVLALVTRLTGWSPFSVLDHERELPVPEEVGRRGAPLWPCRDLAGIALVLTFLVLLPIAVQVLTGDRRASPLVLVLSLTAWGVQQPWRWSGYLSLNSFGFMVGYPSMAAWCALLGAVVAARSAADDRHS